MWRCAICYCARRHMISGPGKLSRGRPIWLTYGMDKALYPMAPGWKVRNPVKSWKSQKSRGHPVIKIGITHDYPTLKTRFSPNSSERAIPRVKYDFQKNGKYKTIPSWRLVLCTLTAFLGRGTMYFSYLSENYIRVAICRAEIDFF